MVNVREERTWVKGYTREGGTRVPGHPSHAVTGEKRWQVYYRGKEKVLPGGTKRNQRRDLNEKWHLFDSYETNDPSAERAKKMLMAKGKHVVIVTIGARSSMPDPKEIEAQLRRADKDRHARRK